MKLFTKAIMTKFPKYGATSEKQANEVPIIVKIFDPCGAATWYLTEYDAENEIFFCFANLGDDTFAELGTVAKEELESYRGRFGLGLERDLHFGKHTLDEVMSFKVR